MRELGRGLDHVAYEDGERVFRFAQGDDAAAQVAREAALLDLVARVSPLPVPRPLEVDTARGCLVYKRLPGVPLLLVDNRGTAAEPVARELGRLLHALRALDPGDLVETDNEPPPAWLGEARAHYASAAQSIPERHRSAIERFLGTPPPAPADMLVFSHNDLGIEHVLVDQDTLAITGVIDWSDAAITDPAADLGLILRDLGEAALEAALASSGSGGDAELVTRARFLARCSLLEDLAYGIQTDRGEYAAKSLAALGRLFA
jgi:aminoglycoside phosphotransferase (APT) family kinase protein